MSGTLQSLLEEARLAMREAGVADLHWVLAEVVAARRTRSGLVLGELGWRSRSVRFVCVNRSLHYRLAHHGASLQPGMRAVFAMRLVVHPRFGFQAEVHDVDVGSIRSDLGDG